MIPKSIEQITEADLQNLITNQVLERKTLDYKEELPGTSNSEKKEFLADVSSFANSSGGDLIFGITEDRTTGYPSRLAGITIPNPDQTILRFEQMIRDGIKPRILGILTRPIALSNSKSTLIIRIPKSWISPHRVTFRGHDKFYTRGSNGKYPMDVDELRAAFILSETLSEKIREFRVDRISKTFSGEAYFPLPNTGKIVLHLIPFTAFKPAQRYDITQIELATRISLLRPMNFGGGDHRFNFDGFLVYRGLVDGKTTSYTQFFTNGIIEAVEGLYLRDGQSIPRICFEETMIEAVPRYLTLLNNLNVDLPIYVLLSFVNVKGYGMTSTTGLSRIRIDREILLVPEVVTDTYTVESARFLRPCFDSIWNACGFPRSMNYNEAGTRIV